MGAGRLALISKKNKNQIAIISDWVMILGLLLMVLVHVHRVETIDFLHVRCWRCHLSEMGLADVEEVFLHGFQEFVRTLVENWSMQIDWDDEHSLNAVSELISKNRLSWKVISDVPPVQRLEMMPLEFSVSI